MYVKIKEFRKKNGDTLQSLSEKINYDYSNLSKVERGVYTPSIELLYKIAEVYKINISELLIEKDQKNILDLTVTENIITVDGKRVTKEELTFLIQSIRIFRQTIKNYSEQKNM
ncbi:TPA: helix-turn-helix domain-containing protein [Bacillus cereus]|uniref:helix-turn-helix domain-containing protein n=1 Tax=Bacillus thuringiensis TaxID=1428 RepID=UPI003730E8FC|nr:helix-turn-helix transcriptional regulator [Bacillus cereus]MDA1769665.1 helix-turn-helix transcriptional regulator [Bacillus cereus]